MNNYASIRIPANFIRLCETKLERWEATDSELKKQGILYKDTPQGLKWAIDFCKSIKADFMTEAELKHAIRLTTFRGRNCPQF